MDLIIFCIVFGFLNRARGSKLYGYADSTVEARLMSTMFMGIVTGMLSLFHYPLDMKLSTMMLLWTWWTLLVWCTPGWDALWSAEIGDDPRHSRLWGLGWMSVRMLLAAPCIAGSAWLEGHSDRMAIAAGSALLGLPYYVWGYILPRDKWIGRYAIFASEVTVGMMIAAMLYLTIV